MSCEKRPHRTTSRSCSLPANPACALVTRAGCSTHPSRACLRESTNLNAWLGTMGTGNG